MAQKKVLTYTGLSQYDSKIKAFINALVAAAEAGKITKQVVEELPPVAQASENVIYLVPNGGSAGNVKDEYMLIGGSFELLGTTEVDLSGYATKSYVDGKFITAISYDAVNHKITSTKNGVTTDLITALQLFQDAGGGSKADKVTNATNGNFAGLDSNGNLTDSGKKAADFATAAQGQKADDALPAADLVEITDQEIDNLFPAS